MTFSFFFFTVVWNNRVVKREENIKDNYKRGKKKKNKARNSKQWSE